MGRLGPLTLYSYGLALAAAFVAAWLWVRHECKKRSIPVEAATDLVLGAAIGGIIGARLFFVAAHFQYFAGHPAEIVRLQQGGLVFYGGLAGGAAGVLLAARLRQLAIAQTADMAAPAIALGSAIGRIGCLLNGCCYGRESGGLLGITFPLPLGGPRYPTQIMDGLYNLLIFALLVWVGRRRREPGFVFWLYGAVYSTFRFGIEFLRDNAVTVGGLSGAQLISLALFAVSAGVLAIKYRSAVGGRAASDSGMAASDSAADR